MTCFKLGMEAGVVTCFKLGIEAGVVTCFKLGIEAGDVTCFKTVPKNCGMDPGNKVIITYSAIMLGIFHVYVLLQNTYSLAKNEKNQIHRIKKRPVLCFLIRINKREGTAAYSRLGGRQN